MVKRHLGEPCEGRGETIQDFPVISCKHLLHLRRQTRKSLQEGAVVWAGKAFRPCHPTPRHIGPRRWPACIRRASPRAGLQPRAPSCSGIAAVEMICHAHQLDIEPGVKTKSPQTWSLPPQPGLALLPDLVHSSRDKRLNPCGHLLHGNRIRI